MSNDKFVTLRDMSLQTSGVFTCEASSEGPRFKTVSETGRIQVDIDQILIRSKIFEILYYSFNILGFYNSLFFCSDVYFA